MRPQKITNQDLLTALLATIRSKGYDGASMKDLETASGLKKASLYHRFPGGKKEIAQRVMGFVGDWISENVIKILTDTAIDPTKRLDLVIQNIYTFYKGGEETCLFRALSLDNSFEIFHTELQFGMKKWLEAFETFGIDNGDAEQIAKEKALTSIILIQGSLLVAKVLNDKSTFSKSLEDIKALYN